MDGYFCLKWNNHSPSFLQNLRSLQEQKLYCDATIACNGSYYPVHKLVLASCSDYFKEIFERVECKHPFLILKDIQPKELEALLDYMYKGEVNVLQDTISGLIHAAKTLRIKGLAIPDDDFSSEEDSTIKSPTGKEKKRSLSPASPLSPPYHSLPKEAETKKLKNDLIRLTGEIKVDKSEDEKQTPPTLSNIEMADSKNNGAVASISSNEEDSLIIPKIEMHSPIKPELLNDDEDSFDDNSVNFFNNSQPTTQAQAQNLFRSLLFPDGQHSIFNSEADQTGLGSSNSLLNMAQCSTWDSTNTDALRANDPGLDEILKGRQCNDLTQSLFGSPGFFAGMSNASDEPLQCDLCNYKCKKDMSMRKHMVRKHSDGSAPEKTYEEENGKIQNLLKCCYCTYATVQPSRLKSHMSIHTGYKPYNCTYCPYKSSQSGTMKRHIQKVHRDKFSN